MTVAKAVAQAYPYLLSQTRRTVVECLNVAWTVCRAQGREPEAHDFVAALVANGPLWLPSRWGVAPGLRISAGGIYCHQAPQVTYQGMQGASCALGDLLLVHWHRGSGEALKLSALLHAVKVSQGYPLTPTGQDADQLGLYVGWPEFSYVSGPLRGSARRVEPPTPHAGAQYLRIAHEPPAPYVVSRKEDPTRYPAGSCMAGPTMRPHSDLAKELLRFLAGSAGRSFDDLPAVAEQGGTGWSRVVWELIQSTAQKALSRARSGSPVQFPAMDALLPAQADGCAAGPAALCDSGLLAMALGEAEAHELASALRREPPADPDSGGPSPSPEEEGGGTSLIVIATSER